MGGRAGGRGWGEGRGSGHVPGGWRRPTAAAEAQGAGPSPLRQHCMTSKDAQADQSGLLTPVHRASARATDHARSCVMACRELDGSRYVSMTCTSSGTTACPRVPPNHAHGHELGAAARANSEPCCGRTTHVDGTAAEAVQAALEILLRWALVHALVGRLGLRCLCLGRVRQRDQPQRRCLVRRGWMERGRAAWNVLTEP